MEGRMNGGEGRIEGGNDEWRRRKDRGGKKG